MGKNVIAFSVIHIYNELTDGEMEIHCLWRSVYGED